MTNNEFIERIKKLGMKQREAGNYAFATRTALGEDDAPGAEYCYTGSGEFPHMYMFYVEDLGSPTLDNLYDWLNANQGQWVPHG